MPHCPQTANVIACIEYICGVNEEESSFLLVVLFDKEGASSMYYALDPSIEAGTELRIVTCVFRLSVSYFQNSFCKYPAPDLVNPNRPDP